MVLQQGNTFMVEFPPNVQQQHQYQQQPQQQQQQPVQQGIQSTTNGSNHIIVDGSLPPPVPVPIMPTATSVPLTEKKDNVNNVPDIVVMATPVTSTTQQSQQQPQQSQQQSMVLVQVPPGIAPGSQLVFFFTKSHFPGV